MFSIFSILSPKMFLRCSYFQHCLNISVPHPSRAIIIYFFFYREIHFSLRTSWPLETGSLGYVFSNTLIICSSGTNSIFIILQCRKHLLHQIWSRFWVINKMFSDKTGDNNYHQICGVKDVTNPRTNLEYLKT